jgi:hypothetical protein
MRRLGRAGVVALAATVVLGVTVVSYFSIERLAQDNGAAAGSGEVERDPTPAPTTHAPPSASGQLDSRDRAVAAEFAKPRFSGEINGIEVRLGAQVEIPTETCSPGNSSNVPIERADGSVVDFKTNYLPEGAGRANSWAVECQGNYILTFSEWSLTAPDIGAATLLITRFVSSNRPFDFDSSADRVSAGEINGKPAVFIEPVLPDEGYGPAGIAIAEDFGITLVTSINLTFDELRRVAEAVQ